MLDPFSAPLACLACPSENRAWGPGPPAWTTYRRELHNACHYMCFVQCPWLIMFITLLHTLLIGERTSENSCNDWSWLIVIEIDWSDISIESNHILIEINQEYFNHVQSHFNHIQPGTHSFCKRVILNQGTILTRHTVLSGRCHCTLKVFSNRSESF